MIIHHENSLVLHSLRVATLNAHHQAPDYDDVFELPVFCIKIIRQDYFCFYLRGSRVTFRPETGYPDGGFSWFFPEPLDKFLEYLQLGDHHFLLLPSTSFDASNLEVLKTSLNKLRLSLAAVFSLFFFAYTSSNFGFSILNVLFNDALNY
jgi:hypothetical protein